MGNLCPYWDGRLPILGADAGLAGNRWDIVVKGFSLRWSRHSWRSVRANLMASSFALRPNLAARSTGLERRSHECYLTDQSDEAIGALEEALVCRRALGDRLGERRTLSRLAYILWCPGRTWESERAARKSVDVLEALPPSRELANAYLRLPKNIPDSDGWRSGTEWGKRALQLAEDLGDTETALEARRTIACGLPERALDELQQVLEEAQRVGLVEQVGLTYLPIVNVALDVRRYDVAADGLAKGLKYCSDHGLELFRLYLLSFQARLEPRTGSLGTGSRHGWHGLTDPLVRR